ncbi:MAG: Gfo/Idh/MocA family oxidoreductase [Gemmatimonadota bacterium]
MPELLNAAVIGCGGHAQHHFRMIAAEPRLHLDAVAELDPERLESARQEHQPERAFRDYREMLEACDLDVVFVLTMPGHLKPIALDCLGRGLHICLEKPPGMSAAETRELADAAGRSPGKSMVSLNRRYLPQVLAVRRLVRRFGGAVHCAATYNKPLTNIGTPALPTTPDPVVCDAIHHVDLLRWLAGPSEERAAVPVAVCAEVLDGPRVGTHRHNALVQFDTGAHGVLMAHYGVGYRIQRAEVHAEDFSAYLDLCEDPEVELYRAQTGADGTAVGLPLDEPLDLAAVGGADFDETRHFVDCILGGRTPWSTVADAVHTMELAEAIRRGHRGPLLASS